MRGRGIFAAAMLAASGAFGLTAVAAPGLQAVVPAQRSRAERRRAGTSYSNAEWAPVRHRSKNAPHRRRLRPNRLHISRRVRRRHRRAR